MCIPCVMCGACMGLDDDFALGMHETECPECGHPVAETDISCPFCYAFLPMNAKERQRQSPEQEQRQE